MPLGSWLRDLLGDSATAVPALGRAERVAALVPSGTDYVTVGLFEVLADAREFIGGEPGKGRYAREFGLTPGQANQPREAGLLVLAGSRLSVVAEEGERWSVDVAQVADLDAHRFSGFVVIARDGSGVVVTQQVPVERSPTGAWRTAGRVLNAFSGWDKLLAPYGAHIHW